MYTSHPKKLESRGSPARRPKEAKPTSLYTGRPKLGTPSRYRQYHLSNTKTFLIDRYEALAELNLKFNFQLLAELNLKFNFKILAELNLKFNCKLLAELNLKFNLRLKF